MTTPFTELSVRQFTPNQDHTVGEEWSLPGVLAPSIAITEEIGEDYSVEFRVVKTKTNRKSFQKVTYQNYITVPANGQTYRIKDLEKAPKGNRYALNVQAEHVFYDIADFKLDKADVINGSRPFEDILRYALDGTGWRYELYGFWSAVTYENFGGENQLKLFLNLMNRHGIEWVPDSVTKTVRLYQRLGGPSNNFIRIKHNMSAIKVNGSTRSLSTIQKGYGKKKSFPEDQEPTVLTDADYIAVAVYRSPLADFWGELWADDFEDERYTTEETLLDVMARGLQDSIELSFDVSAVNVRRNGKLLQNYRLGDDIAVIHEGIDEDVSARITKRVYYPYAKAKSDELTVGNVRDSIVRQTVSTEQTARTAHQTAARSTQTASAARQEAATAKKEAGEATKNAAGANEQAANAIAEANAALDQAREAVAEATAARNLAQNAYDQSGGAEGDASEALRLAQNALNAANGAASVASQAKTTADNAALQAQRAEQAATGATTAAGNATATANGAKTTADNAQSEINNARKGEANLRGKIDKMDAAIDTKVTHTTQAMRIGNAPTLLSIQTPGEYYLTTAESNALPDHPMKNVAGWFFTVSKLAPFGAVNLFQILYRNSGVMPQILFRRVDGNNASNWYVVNATTVL